jgi:hypothetical protein
MPSKQQALRRQVLVGSVAGLGLLLGVWFLGCGRLPQMGADPEVFKAVDALFTAVTSRDEKQLAECEQRLLTLIDAGKVPPAASGHLGKVIGTARAGGWESAAQTLYAFMRAQRREGADDQRSPKKPPGHGVPWN